MKRDYNSMNQPPMSGGNHFVPGDRSMRNNDHHNYHNHHQQHHMHQQQHHNHNHHHNQGNHFAPNYSLINANKGKQLMSFQNYVRTLNNNVDENTAYKKYKDFMANLAQSKVGRFFDANKDIEWFRLKYHPIEGERTLQQQNDNFLKRLKIFTDLNDRNYFNDLSYSTRNASAILNLMDAIILQLDDNGPEKLINQLLDRDETTKIDFELKEKLIPQTRPTSVVLDDLNIETTLAEIQEACSLASPHLIRIAQLDPYYVEGGHLRRKFVAIYNDQVDIKDVCWKLSRMKLHNRMLSVHINKCLSKRIYSIDPIANHHICVVNDIRNAIVLILNFDEFKSLYGKRQSANEGAIQEQLMDTDHPVKMEDSFSSDANNVSAIDNVAPLSPPGSEKSANDEDEEKPFDISLFDEEKEKEMKKLYEFKFNTVTSLYLQVNRLNKSKNPILKGAYNYMVEFIESSTAFYHLTKVPTELQNESTKVELDLDEDKFSTIELIVKNLPCPLEESIKFLDRLLWYLRIVHSFDYYKKSVYRLEDELTLKMSVIHLRSELDEETLLSDEETLLAIRNYLQRDESDMLEFAQSQTQKYVSKDEERFNYKSYGKVITDELASYTQRIQKPKSTETEEVYKCKHCTRVFQKLSDIGRHFVSKHRWAIDAIELETDFFNAYLFDPTKINPCPPKELLEVPPNRFAKMTNFSQMGEDPDLQQTIEAYSKMESFVREPAPRAQVESDPRNESIVDYADISFDDAI